MKKYLYFSMAAVALASCTSDEFVGEGPGPNNVTNETPKAIDFGSFTGKVTRAELTGAQAADKLNNNFIVYGFKYYSDEPITATDVANAEKQQKVFDRYNVNYTAGSDNTTESNTKGWEYVGYTSVGGVEQTIKYWDYTATGYVFSAVSGTGITADKIESVANGATDNGDPVTTPMAWSSSSSTLTREEGGTATVYDKGWVVTIPQGGSLSDLYASERTPIAKTKYLETVSLKFYNLGAKVRFGFYEIIPGYKVTIDRFYYNSTNSETNFGVDGNFTTLKTDGDSKLIVTYYESVTLKNRPKVTPLDGSVSSATYGEFGTNIQAASEIGTASNEATYDQAGGLYTDIIPMKGNGMNLKIDYTLTSTDGSKETIKVKSATAQVPENFTDWKANFAYTYLFKISDNTNGNTGTSTDPAGLYPITFDACVVGNEDGIQETITSVADPSITTYQKGEVVTKYNEYVAGDIYFENDALDISNYHVYEVNNYGTEATTEEVVANWKNNFCVLTEVTVTKSTGTETDGFIPLSDNTFIKKAANQAAKFTAVAGKTYVIVNDEADALDPATAGAQCKIVKVAGGPAAATYTLYTDALAGSASTLTLGGFDSSDQANPATGKLYLAEGGVGVIGAMPLFTVTPDVTGNNGLVIAAGSAAGEYDLSINANAVNAGTAKGDYTVKFNNGATATITIGTTNELWDNAATPAALSAAAVTAGGSAVTAVLKIDNAASNAGVIVNAYEDKGVTVTNSDSNGEYTISATQNATPGVYNVTIAGETVAVTVTNYAFAAASYTYDKKTDNSLVGPASVDLNIEAGTAAATTATAVAASALTYNTTDLTLTGTAGSYTVTAVAATQGEYTVTYGSTAATTKIIVNKYAIDGGTIDRSTGRLELGVTVNATAVNASAAKVKITNDSDSDADVTSSFTVQTNGQKIVLTGAKSTLTPGAYTVHYYLEAGKTNEVATSALTVN